MFIIELLLTNLFCAGIKYALLTTERLQGVFYYVTRVLLHVYVAVITC
jgi:hypothetical protein